MAFHALASAILSLTFALSLGAQQSKAPNPAFRKVADVAGLPRALLIGDSISIGYTNDVQDLLAGKANVHRIPVNGGPTTRGLEQIDDWLGDGDWDVIHFNWGLHDLRFMEDGRRQVSPDEYRVNLERLVTRLEETGAQLIWASTTPVPDAKVTPHRDDRDVVAYNRIAAEIMGRRGVAIDDLYDEILPALAEVQRPANVHFLPAGSKLLAGAVVRAIRAAL